MRSVFFSILLLGFSFPVLSENLLIDETKRIQETIYNYFNGVKNSDETLLNKAFELDKAHMKGFLVEANKDIELTATPIKEVIKRWVSREKRPEMKGEILSIRVYGPAATVTFNFNNQYIDFFHLAKTKSGWKIINKFYIYK